MTEELSDKEIAELEELKIEITTPVKDEEETADEAENSDETVAADASNEENGNGSNEIWKTFAIDPETGYAVDPNTGNYVDPDTGAVIGATFSDEEPAEDQTDNITEITYDENGVAVNQ